MGLPPVAVVAVCPGKACTSGHWGRCTVLVPLILGYFRVGDRDSNPMFFIFFLHQVGILLLSAKQTWNGRFSGDKYVLSSYLVRCFSEVHVKETEQTDTLLH